MTIEEVIADMNKLDAEALKAAAEASKAIERQVNAKINEFLQSLATEISAKGHAVKPVGTPLFLTELNKS